MLLRVLMSQCQYWMQYCPFHQNPSRSLLPLNIFLFHFRLNAVKDHIEEDQTAYVLSSYSNKSLHLNQLQRILSDSTEQCPDLNKNAALCSTFLHILYGNQTAIPFCTYWVIYHKTICILSVPEYYVLMVIPINPLLFYLVWPKQYLLCQTLPTASLFIYL